MSNTIARRLAGCIRGSGSSWTSLTWREAAAASLAVVLAGCSGTQPSSPIAEGGGDADSAPPIVEPVSAPEPSQPAEVLMCADGFRFSLAEQQDAVRVWVAGDSRVLERTLSASGARFTDGDWTFWGQGGESLFEHESVVHTGCRHAPRELVWERARLRGVLFRALGNEPGWLVEISADGVRAELDYGRTVYELPPVELPEGGDSIGVRSRDEEHRLALEAVREECSDTMSDTVYPWRVAVTIDRLELSGCGRRLDQE